jgi:hypothetical protein
MLSFKDLDGLVNVSYEIFGVYQLNGKALDVCRCNVCISEEVEQRLIKTPLREVRADTLRIFTSSAHATGNHDEVRYFLPRFFELLASGKSTSYTGHSLFSLEKCQDWRTLWRQEEVELIDDYLDSLMFRSAASNSPCHSVWGEVPDILSSLGRNPMPVLVSILKWGSKDQINNVLALSSSMSNDKLSCGSQDDGKKIGALLMSDLAIESGMRALDLAEQEELNFQLESSLDYLCLKA